MINNEIFRHFINDLLNKIDIVDFINKKIRLKKYGKYYQAFCPFHKEKTPSFMVNRDKKFYYCFGCGTHGNVINFFMNFEKINFVETVKSISNMYGLNIPNIFNNDTYYNIYIKSSNKLYLIMNKISILYNIALYNKTSKLARLYLYSRGLTDEIINIFCIGYAINSSNNLINQLLKKYKINYKELHDTGMFINKNNYLYDRFRDRIMFPIRDRKGRCIGFGGRTLNKIIPKYLNSPETEIFHKGKELFGLYEVLNCNDKIISKLLIVEGYMDVITLTQFGINYSVSSLGTSTTIEHIKILFQITDNIICCYDGDDAGRKAAWRTLNISLPILTDGKKIQFLFLPEGEDPDSLIRKEGKKNFENRFNNLCSLSTLLFNTLTLGIKLSDYEDKAKFNVFATRLIKKIPSETLKLCLTNKLNKFIGIPDVVSILNVFTNITPVVLKYNQKNIKIQLTPMRILIALLIKNPDFICLINDMDIIKNLKLPGLNLFLKIIELFKLYPGLNTIQLLDHYYDTIQYKQLIKLANWNMINDKDVAKKMFKDTLNHLKDIYFTERFNFLIKKARNVGLTVQERKEVNLIVFKKI